MQRTTRFPLRARTLAARLFLALALLLPAGLIDGRSAQAGDLEEKRPQGEDLDTFFDAATRYLDLDEDLYVGRLAFTESLEAQHAKNGFDLFADMPFLRDTIYQCRYFRPQMSDKRWRDDEDIASYKNKGPWHHLKSDDIHLAFALPKSYPKKNKVFFKRPRPDPLPLVISTIQRQDYTGQDFPGFSLLKRRFPKDLAGSMLNSWSILVPIAPAGKYVGGDGKLIPYTITYQASRFFEHYNVDFDRIVLDGGPEVLLSGTSRAVMFAGLILRTRETLSEDMKSLVPNFAPVPIFVVDCPATTQQIIDAGHPSVTNGSAADIPEWIEGLRRKTPTKFTWRLTGSEHQFAYWINMEQVNWAAPEQKIEVEVVDTDEDPNTIKINAVGIRELSLFLNDDIVDLSRKVRLVVNGHVEVDAMQERNLDITFNRDPLKIRESLYFGLLFPVRLNRVIVRAPKVDAPVNGGGPDVTSEGTPEDEARAKKLMDTAKKYIDAGKNDGAKKRLEAIISIGQTSLKAEAEKLLSELSS